MQRLGARARFPAPETQNRSSPDACCSLRLLDQRVGLEIGRPAASRGTPPCLFSSAGSRCRAAMPAASRSRRRRYRRPPRARVQCPERARDLGLARMLRGFFRIASGQRHDLATWVGAEGGQQDRPAEIAPNDSHADHGVSQVTRQAIEANRMAAQGDGAFRPSRPCCPDPGAGINTGAWHAPTILHTRGGSAWRAD